MSSLRPAFLAGLLVMLGCGHPLPGPAPAGSSTAPEPVPRHHPQVRGYLVRRGGVVVDGRLDEPAWRDATWSDRFVDIEGPRRPAPPLETRVKLAWDDTALYVGASLEEPDLWATQTVRDTVIFADNDFEMFLDPDGGTANYFEFEINAWGTVWDLRLARPYRDGGRAETGWDAVGLKSAVALDGTINHPGDRDRGWTVELAVPWAALGRHPPAEGEQWRVNFSRVEWALDEAAGRYVKRRGRSTGRPLPEANWVWSPQYAVNMHLPELWGVVQFTGRKGAGPVDPLPALEPRWSLRRVYYAEREYRVRHGSYSGDLSALGLAGLGSDVALHAADGGFEATTPGPGGAIWRIDHEGRLYRP
jgi:cellulose/xylan binding protein with CBM9 domain